MVNENELTQDIKEIKRQVRFVYLVVKAAAILFVAYIVAIIALSAIFTIQGAVLS